MHKREKFSLEKRHADELVVSAMGHERREMKLNQDRSQRIISCETNLTRKFAKNEWLFFLVEAIYAFLQGTDLLENPSSRSSLSPIKFQCEGQKAEQLRLMREILTRTQIRNSPKTPCSEDKASL